MSRLNISQASRAAGVSRSTLYAHIKKGRLTAHKAGDGRTYVDASELARVYGSLKIEGVQSVASGVETVVSETVVGRVSVSEAELEALRVENRLLKDQLRKAEDREEEARREVRDLLDVVKSQTRLLQGDREEAPGRRRRWWHFKR